MLYPGRVAQRKSSIPNPDIRVTDRTSPTFLVHSYDDPMNPVDNSLAYAAALRKAGVPSEIHIFANGGHAFGLRSVDATATAWAPLAEAWMRAIGVLGRLRRDPSVSRRGCFRGSIRRFATFIREDAARTIRTEEIV